MRYRPPRAQGTCCHPGIALGAARCCLQQFGGLAGLRLDLDAHPRLGPVLPYPVSRSRPTPGGTRPARARRSRCGKAEGAGCRSPKAGRPATLTALPTWMCARWGLSRVSARAPSSPQGHVAQVVPQAELGVIGAYARGEGRPAARADDRLFCDLAVKVSRVRAIAFSRP